MHCRSKPFVLPSIFRMRVGVSPLIVVSLRDLSSLQLRRLFLPCKQDVQHVQIGHALRLIQSQADLTVDLADLKAVAIFQREQGVRQADMQLILCYYNRYSYMRVGDLPLEDIVNNYKGYGLPCFETIRRARQRVQSLFPELSRQCSGCDCGNIRIVIEVS